MNETSSAQLLDKAVLITGASSGIGRAAARVFARRGAHLVLGARRGPALEELADELRQHGRSVLVVAGAVQDEAWHREVVRRAVEEFGRLDVAFNNAGILGRPGPLHDLSLDDWDEVVGTNLTGAFLGAKHQAPIMSAAGKGSILFTGSFVGHGIGLSGMAAYGATKAALVGLTQCLAAELGPAGVRVNALLPGGTETAMAADFASDAAARERVESLHALGRIARPEEIARAAAFLASDDSSFVTGTAMVVDGGNSIHKP